MHVMRECQWRLQLEQLDASPIKASFNPIPRRGIAHNAVVPGSLTNTSATPALDSIMRKSSKTGSYGNRTQFGRKLNSKVRQCAVAAEIKLVPQDGSRVELIVAGASHGIFDDTMAAMAQVSALTLVRSLPTKAKKPRSERVYDVTPIRGSDHVRLYVDGKFEGVFSSAAAAGSYVADRTGPRPGAPAKPGLIPIRLPSY
jgi:hypothetical protein